MCLQEKSAEEHDSKGGKKCQMDGDGDSDGDGNGDGAVMTKTGEGEGEFEGRHSNVPLASRHVKAFSIEVSIAVEIDAVLMWACTSSLRISP